MTKNSNLFGLLLVLLLVFFAVGFWTFYNAKGASYLSSSSEACNNCHVMNEVYLAYTQSPHAKLKKNGQARAGCVDCHLPHGFLSKWIAKVESGIGHAYAFTFKLDELPANLVATPKSKATVQANCVSCHSRSINSAINASTNPHANNALNCVSCHKDVGHTHGI